MSSLFLNRVTPPLPLADELFFMGFNQDYSCLASGVSNGFRIFNCDPYKETFKREFSGGIGMVEMLFRCNILALVGGGSEPAFPKTKVVLWDDNQSTPIGELTFKSDVKGVKLRRDKIIVVLEKHVYVYNFEKLERKYKFDTIQNTKGLIAVSPIGECVIAFPHTTKGQVNIQLLDSETKHIIQAHDGNINCLALNLDGTRLATASEKGTLIRIFDTAKGTKLQEVRRGADKAVIYSLAFSQDSSFLCSSSDKGTIHVFSLHKAGAPQQQQQQQQQQQAMQEGAVEPSATSGTSSPDVDKKSSALGVKNRMSKLQIFGGYFGSEWSFAWYKGPECPSICCFGQDNKSVIVFSSDGSHLRLTFDPKKGGECERKTFSRFFKSRK